MKTHCVRAVISGAMLSFFALGLVGAPALLNAQTSDPARFKTVNTESYFQGEPGGGPANIVPGTYKDPRQLARNIINIILGFLGIIAVVIILYAGFQWMTAGGEEEKVGEARQRLIQGAIGLILIIAAWIIAYFVIDALVKAIQGPAATS